MRRVLTSIFIIMFIVGAAWALLGLWLAPAGHPLAVFPAAVMLVLSPLGLASVMVVSFVFEFVSAWRGRQEFTEDDDDDDDDDDHMAHEWFGDEDGWDDDDARTGERGSNCSL